VCFGTKLWRTKLFIGGLLPLFLIASAMPTRRFLCRI
jgi:hypothetical protein